jgi:hypothetical protein
MIRITITAAAYDAIRSTLPQDALLGPVECQSGRFLIRVKAAVVDRLWAMRGPGESTATSLQHSTSIAYARERVAV